MICPSPSAAWCSSAGGSLSSSTAPSSWPGSWTPGWQERTKRADRRDRGPQEHDAQHLPRPAQPSLRRQRRAGNAGIGPRPFRPCFRLCVSALEFLRRLTEDLFLAAKLEQKQILLSETAPPSTRKPPPSAPPARRGRPEGRRTPSQRRHASARLGRQRAVTANYPEPCHQCHPYTPAGGNIHVDCRAEGETACVSVQDTGCGIAPEDQSAVFDRYFHTTADKKHDSTGLGLTIAQGWPTSTTARSHCKVKSARAATYRAAAHLLTD